MIYVAICDDETSMSEHIRSVTSEFFRRKNMETIILRFSSGELLKYDGQIDILFLDIQMKNIDGMETARKLRENKFRGFLIFITVLREMVFQSFEVQAYDYLVKPVEREQFEKTMERLCESMQNAKDEIIFCEIIDRKIYLNLASDEVIDYYERIENLEARLNNWFFRCHRSYLINLRHLRSYKNSIAYMDNGGEIPVSRLRSREFSSVILKYMKSI